MSKRLRKIQRGFRDTPVEQLNPDGTWTRWLPIPTEPSNSKSNLIHLFDVDRFLSIYNKPVRRRQMGHEPGAYFPETLVLRNPADSSIYVIGAERTDTVGGLTVETLTTLHQVGKTYEVHRRVLSETATPSDPGWLELELVGEFYFDSELRTVTEESAHAGEFVGKFFTFTNCSVLEPNDVISSENSPSFIVEAPYKDAGFYSARIAQLKDTREDIQIVKEAAIPSGSGGWNPHDPDGTSSTELPEEYNITAWVGASMTEPVTDTIASNELKVFVDEYAIGFEPTISCTIKARGVDWKVGKVSYNYQFEQYRLDCSRV